MGKLGFSVVLASALFSLSSFGQESVLLEEGSLKLQNSNPESAFKEAARRIERIAQLYQPAGAQISNKIVKKISDEAVSFVFDATIVIYTPHIDGELHGYPSQTALSCKGTSAELDFLFENQTSPVVRGNYSSLRLSVCVEGATLRYRGVAIKGDQAGLTSLEKLASGTVLNFIKKQVAPIRQAMLTVISEVK